MRIILKYILVSGLILLAGCSDNSNLDIDQLNQQATVLKDHLYEISGDKDFYENEKIDFSLLKNIKNVVLERSQNIILSHRDDKIQDQVLDEGLNKSISLLYLIWMEEADAARRNNDLENLKYIQKEQSEFSSQKEVSSWIEDNGKNDSHNRLQQYLDSLPQLLEQGKKIDENNERLNVLRADADRFKTENNIVEYNRVADEYNVLLEENNRMVDDYNSKLEGIDYNKIYDDFINMIDVGFIFPGQDTIPLKQ